MRSSLTSAKKTSLKHRLYYVFAAGRPSQWIKNLVVYIAILFNGELFNPKLFWYSTYTFIIFCAISSASYIFNDIVDRSLDRKHPAKRRRPIASGKLGLPDATFALFLLIITTITASLFLRVSLAILVGIFFLLHVVYSLYLKKHVLFDIFTISASFIIRLLAGEIITGYHVPVWLWLTVFFFALFIASVKRHSEIINQGTATRIVLKEYTTSMLQFLVTTFAAMTIIAYSLYSFVEEPPHIRTRLSILIEPFFHAAETRKWFMLTIPFAVFAIIRYAQLLYEHREGEAPEKIITKDKILVITLGLWGLILITLIYIL
jgi:decaprenyl-phosphate phosphoribosyltransferase